MCDSAGFYSEGSSAIANILIFFFLHSLKSEEALSAETFFLLIINYND